MKTKKVMLLYTASITIILLLVSNAILRSVFTDFRQSAYDFKNPSLAASPVHGGAAPVEETTPKNKNESEDIEKARKAVELILEEDRKDTTGLPASNTVEEAKLPEGNGTDTAWLPMADTAEMKNFAGTKRGIYNILFLGIDRTEARDKTLGVYRTDTIALASVNAVTKKVQVLCIPRDTYVYIPKIDKMDKINHAYVWGGMEEKGIKSTIDTVNKFIKYASVDYYFAIDMEPVPDIVDSIGGVEVDVEIDMNTHGANLSKGKQVLNGEQAYTYIRWRYSGNGDIDRIKRQQNFLKAAFSKLKAADQLSNALKIVLKHSKYVKTDMDFFRLLSLMDIARNIFKDDIVFFDIPGTAKTIDKVWYWAPDQKRTDEMLKKIFD